MTNKTAIKTAKIKRDIREYIDNELTVGQLRRFCQTTDKLLWIEYHILDMLNDGKGVSNHFAEYAEQFLLATILEAHHDANLT